MDSFSCLFSHTTTPDLSPLSLHDALPIFTETVARERLASTPLPEPLLAFAGHKSALVREDGALVWKDRKSTRLNSSHLVISYAVFCLKKKKKCDNQQL